METKKKLPNELIKTSMELDVTYNDWQLFKYWLAINKTTMRRFMSSEIQLRINSIREKDKKT